MSINENFEPDFNAVFTSAIVFQHPDKDNLNAKRNPANKAGRNDKAGET